MNKDVHDFAEDVVETLEEDFYVPKEHFAEYKRFIASAMETQGTTTVKGENVTTPVGLALQALEGKLVAAEQLGSDHVIIKEKEALFLADLV